MNVTSQLRFTYTKASKFEVVPAEQPSCSKVLFAGIFPHSQTSSMQRIKKNTQCSGNTVARQPIHLLTACHLIPSAFLNICYYLGLILIKLITNNSNVPLSRVRDEC